MRAVPRFQASASLSRELPGLSVFLDELIREPGPMFPAERECAFVYFLTLRNESDREVRFLARKWLIAGENGKKVVIEGDGIVGETPLLRPGESFSYNSFHIVTRNAVATGSFHGVDALGNRVFVRIPAIQLNFPDTR